jgi:DNA-binding transcriptional regulator YdaS (Cro superfamily)
MCAQILRQCEVVRGGREPLADFLGVHPSHVAIWLSGREGPPRAVFERAMEIILAEHDRRAALEQGGRTPRRRRTDSV